MNWVAGLSAVGGAVIGGVVGGVAAHYYSKSKSTRANVALVAASVGMIVGASIPDGAVKKT